MRLNVEDIAPDFSADSWDGPAISLASLRGHNVWLGFYRYASCPLCNMRIQEVIRRSDALSAGGLKLLAVFQSPADSIADYVGRQSPPFPLLSDPTETLYKAYGLGASSLGFLAPQNGILLAKAASLGFIPGRMEGTKTRVPGDFLIDEEGVLRDVFYGKIISDHIPMSRVEQFLQC